MSDPPSDTDLEELERLSNLRRSGALTDEQFEEQKRQLLYDRSAAPDEAPAREGSDGTRAVLLAVLVLCVALAAALAYFGRSGLAGNNSALARNAAKAASQHPAAPANLSRR
jgi:hypothetical protein